MWSLDQIREFATKLRGKMNFYNTVDTGPHLIIDAAPNRWGLVFFPPSGGKVWLLNERTTVSEPGMPLASGSSVVHLLKPIHGDVVCKPVWLTAGGTGFAFGWIEIYLDD